jgi:hypothetical protein
LERLDEETRQSNAEYGRIVEENKAKAQRNRTAKAIWEEAQEVSQDRY